VHLGVELVWDFEGKIEKKKNWGAKTKRNKTFRGKILIFFK